MIGTQGDSLYIVLGNYILKDFTNLLRLNRILKLNHEVTTTCKVNTLAQTAYSQECYADDSGNTEY